MNGGGRFWNVDHILSACLLAYRRRALKLGECETEKLLFFFFEFWRWELPHGLHQKLTCCSSLSCVIFLLFLLQYIPCLIVYALIVSSGIDEGALGSEARFGN